MKACFFKELSSAAAWKLYTLYDPELIKAAKPEFD
jgi:hypothetical protein